MTFRETVNVHCSTSISFTCTGYPWMWIIYFNDVLTAIVLVFATWMRRLLTLYSLYFLKVFFVLRMLVTVAMSTSLNLSLVEGTCIHVVHMSIYCIVKCFKGNRTFGNSGLSIEVENPEKQNSERVGECKNEPLNIMMFFEFLFSND